MSTEVIVSCGVLILAEGRLLVAHATGTSHWDIPKGQRDPGESSLAAALREAWEETGIVLPAEALVDLGEHPYRPGKRVHLFAVQVAADAIDPRDCQCRSLFMHPRWQKELPEVDAYQWVVFDEVPSLCPKSLVPLLKTLDLVSLADRLPVTALR